MSKTGRDNIFKKIRWNILPLIVKIQLKLSFVMQLFYLIRKEGQGCPIFNPAVALDGRVHVLYFSSH